MAVVDQETERRFSVLAHASALCGFFVPLGQILGPYLVSLLVPLDAERARRHVVQALNFQLNVMALVVVLVFALVWLRAGAWFLVLVVPNLYAFAMAIWGATRASRGHPVRYPLTVGILPAARRETPEPSRPAA